MADIHCPTCGESFHETTEAFRLGEVTTGNMLRLKAVYVTNGWTSFPEHEGMSHGDLWCPGCEGAYSTDGRVRINMEQYEAEQAAKQQAVDDVARRIDEFQRDVVAALRVPREILGKDKPRKPGRPKRV